MHVQILFYWSFTITAFVKFMKYLSLGGSISSLYNTLFKNTENEVFLSVASDDLGEDGKTE